MKIGSTPDAAVHAALTQGVGTAATSGSAGVAGPARTGAAPGTDKVDMSAAGASIGLLSASSGDFDTAKVDAIRQAIRDGRFKVNADAIASRLIDDAAQFLRPSVSK